MLSSPKLILLLAILGCAVAYAQAGFVVGGLGEEKQADDHVKNIVKSVEHLLTRSHYPSGFSQLIPISYKSQVVSGTNYFVKAKLVDNERKTHHVHLRIYRPFSGQLELTSVKKDVSEDTEIRYFQ